MGIWFVAGGAAVGLGALCYYGLGMSNEIGAIEKAVIWPQYVKDRIHSTYMYLAGSIGLTALSALAVARNPALMNFMMRGSWVTIGATFGAMIGAGMLVRSIPYEQSPGQKHLAWLLHSGVMGEVVAPLTILGGPLLIRAAWYTAGIMGGLSTVAINQGEMAHTCRGTINLATVQIGTEDSCGILLISGARNYHLKSSSEVDRQQWITALELAKAKAVRMMNTHSEPSQMFLMGEKCVCKYQEQDQAAVILLKL
ncbi:Growth hormone-inducible transmembrane protein [Heterocephalus glaber]|uniref:Growth hormone-inducible transmembrane protein n=1 Tax=Heterocephalus glaber TaxID=10181 RepID=G5C6A4_HETGA|nr:Growth hormone-inducible transmembrane protein [Heterocephalus glaber]